MCVCGGGVPTKTVGDGGGRGSFSGSGGRFIWESAGMMPGQEKIHVQTCARIREQSIGSNSVVQ